MFSKILIATDFSSEAFAVSKGINGLRAYGTRECLLLLGLSLLEDNSTKLLHTNPQLEKYLQELRQTLEKQGLKVETRIVDRLTKNEIIQISEEEKSSLIVVGAQTSSLINESLTGGVAYEITHCCRKPIFIIRLAEIMVLGISNIEPVRCQYNEHILFPTDFSETADQAFRIVKQLVRAGAQKVTLMHVQEQARIEPHLLSRLDEFNKTDEDRLASMKEVLQKEAAVDVDMIVTYGNASKEIIRVVKNHPVQLVVMGSQGRGYVKELFIGSVSHNVARHAEASVLLIPAKENNN
ncbi:MAG: universal stress protein [Eubacteriales bacterium]